MSGALINTNDDTTRYLPLSPELYTLCSLHCYGENEAKPNFEMVQMPDPTGGTIVDEIFEEHLDGLLRKKVADGIFEINNRASNGIIFNVDSTVTKWSKLPPKDDYKITYSAELIEQECPFRAKAHKRGGSLLYCLIQVDSVTLRCYDCTKLDTKSKCRVEVTPGANEVDHTMQIEYAAEALISRSDESIANAIFHWVKDLVAANETIDKKSGKSAFSWYYFDPSYHVWVKGDKKIIALVMNVGGHVQARFKGIQTQMMKAFEENATDNAGAKRKALSGCIAALTKQLQSSRIQSTVLPLVARKVAHYYQDRDKHRRRFEEQLDTKGHLLATLDGVIDFSKNGKLRKGRQSDLISKNINNHYTPWKDLDEENQEEVINYFRELFPVTAELKYTLWCLARALNGANRRQCMYFAIGAGGDGKSVLFGKVLRNMLHSLSRDGQPATICGVDTTDGSAPRADLIFMKNARFFNFTEFSEKDILNNSRFKQLTGGEVVSAAAKFGDQEEIDLQATFFIIGNYKMRIEALWNDFSVWRRVKYLLFRRRYRASEAEMTGVEYESLALPNEKLNPMVDRLSLSALSYLVEVYSKTSHITEWEEPQSLIDIRDEVKSVNDVWLKFINEETTVSEVGISVNEIWPIFVQWLKNRGSGKRAYTIDSFKQHISAYLGAPISLANGESGWMIELRNVETADAHSHQQQNRPKTEVDGNLINMMGEMNLQPTA